MARLGRLALVGALLPVLGFSQPPSTRSTPPRATSSRATSQGPGHAYTRQQELNLGRTMLGTMLATAPAIEAPALDQYLQASVSRIAKQFPQLQFLLVVTVIAGRIGGATHEPSTLPGGYIAIPADLILQARREDEFVGMLAHAIAHSAEGHPSQVISSSGGGTGGTAPGAAGTAQFSTAGASAFPVVMTGIQPSDEPVADALGARAMAAAGYDPKALLDYLERVNNFRRLFASTGVDDDGALRLDKLRRVVEALSANPKTQPSQDKGGEVTFAAAQQAVIDALGQLRSQ